MALRPDYASVDELKRYLRIPGLYEGSINTSEDTYDDAELALAITSASRAIDTATNRQFGSLGTATAFRYTARFDANRNAYVVRIEDLMDSTGLIVKTEGTEVFDFDLYPFNAPSYGKPWTLLIIHDGVSTEEGDIEVTAKWGWTSVPATIKNATLLQAARLFKRREAPFGVAGSPDMGNEIRLLAKLDPDVAVLVGSYAKRWGAV
jgi:hypothetical protein